jgi:hypothetical protein
VVAHLSDTIIARMRPKADLMRSHAKLGAFPTDARAS